MAGILQAETDSAPGSVSDTHSTIDGRATRAVDYGALKIRQQAAWSDGDYGPIGITLQGVGEQLAEALDLRPGERVLDVAGGNGNFTLAAARRRTRVTSIDFVTRWLSQTRDRLRVEGLDATLRLADAEDLPFRDGAFDVSASTFGVMFCPDHTRAAAEIVRVTGTGGRIGMTHWTPRGLFGRMMETVARFAPPPNALPFACRWGTPEHVRTHFGEHARRLSIATKTFVVRDDAPSIWLERFRRNYGPLKRAFDALDDDKQARLERALLDVIADFDRGETVLIAPAEYLEVVVELR